MPASTLQRQHEEAEYERKWAHYQKCQGVGRRVAADRYHERVAEIVSARKKRSAPPATTLEEVEQILKRREAVQTELRLALAYLPRGQGRRDAVRACERAGISRAEIARLLGVDRSRVSHILKEEGIPF